MEINQLTIKEASEKLEKGETNSVELTQSCFKRIKEVDSKIHACLTVCEEEALKAAKEADARRAKGEKGNLLGIPFIAKDNIMTKGIRTTAASKILENYIAPYDATVIKRLKEAGAVLLAKANLDEFAHGASTENSAFGPTHNPHDPERVPGGSSGGSAAAVAADMCLFALGTDTGGSIRHPAAYCGVVGLKPTYGRSSRFGLIAMTSSTDVPGPLAKTSADAALVLRAIAGQDDHDATTARETIPDYENDMKRGVRGLKIGLPREFFTDDLKKEVRGKIDEAISVFKTLGAEFIEISLPHTKYAVSVYYIITPSEISSNLSRFDGIKYGFSTSLRRPERQNGGQAPKEEGENTDNLLDVYMKSRGIGFGPEAKRRIMIGTYALSAGYYDAYYLKAQKVRTIIKNELDRELAELDAILTPTAPDVAFKIGAKGDPLSMYLEDIFMASASLAGLPAINIPAGFIDKLPVGMQIIGKRFDEAMLFRLGHAFEQSIDNPKQALVL
jgi:aspartyl-tRNA(Asn)/glutamyl-tRNA(Gln) amidotransferase subunit A